MVHIHCSLCCSICFFLIKKFFRFKWVYYRFGNRIFTGSSFCYLQLLLCIFQRFYSMLYIIDYPVDNFIFRLMHFSSLIFLSVIFVAFKGRNFSYEVPGPLASLALFFKLFDIFLRCFSIIVKKFFRFTWFYYRFFNRWAFSLLSSSSVEYSSTLLYIIYYPVDNSIYIFIFKPVK